jgi:acyl carrier protein
LGEAISTSITKKLAHLLLLQPDQLSATTRLGTFGMDSMLAAEFRMFIFTTLGTEISFQVLLEKDTTIAALTELITNSLDVKTNGD